MCKTFFQRITFLESRQIWTEMIIIDTIVGPSTVAGSGIFANEDVKNGDVVWMLHPSLGVFKYEFVHLIEINFIFCLF